MSNTKFCISCGFTKKRIKFYNNKAKSDGLSSWCKDCNKTYQKNSNRKQYDVKRNKTTNRKKSTRNTQLKCNFGITLEDYNRILESQNGKCKICGSIDPGGRGCFHVDHNHENSKIRGLLCSRCNLMLGHARDSIKILLKSISYLQEGR